MEEVCQEGNHSSLEHEIQKAMQEATRGFQPFPKYAEFEAELQRLRVIRWRTERRYRRTKSIHDLGEARWMQNKIQRHIDALQSQRSKRFCEWLDACQRLSQIRRTASGLRVPFKYLALRQD